MQLSRNQQSSRWVWQQQLVGLGLLMLMQVCKCFTCTSSRAVLQRVVRQQVKRRLSARQSSSSIQQ